MDPAETSAAKLTPIELGGSIRVPSGRRSLGDCSRGGGSKYLWILCSRKQIHSHVNSDLTYSSGVWPCLSSMHSWIGSRWSICSTIGCENVLAQQAWCKGVRPKPSTTLAGNGMKKEMCEWSVLGIKFQEDKQKNDQSHLEDHNYVPKGTWRLIR